LSVFNEAIKDNEKIILEKTDKMWSFGTPKDMEYFLQNY